MARQLAPALRAVLAFTVLLGLGYPLLMTAVGQGLFAQRADGSLVEADGEVVGSRLLGQAFTEPEHLHSRPSAAGDGYDGAASSGSNLGPSSEDLAAAVAERVAAYRDTNGLDDAVPVPVDAVTASGSGLDPHVSVANARLQAPRIAEARGVEVAEVQAVIDDHTRRRELGFLGEDAVDVLAVNLALDGLDQPG